MNGKSCIVLFSGGQDSTTCLFWAKKKFKSVIALNICYGQRHQIEIQSAIKIANMAKVEYIGINIEQLFTDIGNSALLNTTQSISSNHPKSSNLPASFVPGRNIVFLTAAAMFAYKYDAKDIVTGVCGTDFSGYADCRDNTIKSLQVTLSLALDKEITIHTPLMWLKKAETVEMARSLGPQCWEALGASHTCYEGEFPPCEKCPACKLRAKGFDEAGYLDPLTEDLF